MVSNQRKITASFFFSTHLKSGKKRAAQNTIKNTKKGD